MKRTLTILSLIIAVLNSYAQEFEKASDAVVNMKVGWNLGNTLDVASESTSNMWIERYTDMKPDKYETGWGQPVTKPELIEMFKDAGFNAIRVPVTWYPHLGGIVIDGLNWDKEKYPLGEIVDSAWMKRVHEVVDYVISAGMYCIINAHHDTGNYNVAWLVANSDSYNANKDRYRSLWVQIAREFKDYDEHLLFESYNEMIDELGSWSYASSKASGGYDENVALSAYDAVNGYAQTFVDAVRSTGGNNVYRNLIVTDYAASNCRGKEHALEPFTNMIIPEDTLNGHIILQVHSYIMEMKDLNASKQEAMSLFNDLDYFFIQGGIPVVIGEWGTLNRAGTDYSDSIRYSDFKKYCRFFVQEAKKRKIATYFWMHLSDKEDRSIPRWTLPDLKDEIIEGYYGSSGYVGVVPIAGQDNSGYDSTYWLNDKIIIRRGRKYYLK